MGAALACVLSLSACASMSEKMSTTMAENSMIGLPTNAPARPEAPPAFPAVHDMPAPRPTPMLTGLEQQKMEDDLVQARQQLDGTATQKTAEKTKKAKKDSATAVPAASRTIY